jgi:hypothetical protein
MPRRKTQHWYSRRTANDAPAHVNDMAATLESAWADGYNSAVQAYMDEVREVMRAEGVDVDGSWMTR